jgi:hypothetical protein
LNAVPHRRLACWLARIAAFTAIVVLVCVPALTRIGQRLEVVSHGSSFSKNIDCPPKKVTIAPLFALASPVPATTDAPIPVARLATRLDVTRPPSLERSAPPPLRAPPSALLA